MNNNFTISNSIKNLITDKTVVKEGDLFIIPNELIKFDNMVPSEQERVKGEWEFPSVGKNDFFAQVWATNSECENWYAHKLEKYPGANEGKESWEYIFPGILPVEIFHRKQEGDTIEIYNSTEDVLFRLTLCQEKYRYRDHGKFHEVVSLLEAKAFIAGPATGYTKDLSLKNDETIVLEGDMFIVPNSITRIGNLLMYNDIQYYMQKFYCNKDDQLLQVWACNEENDNWHDHYYDYEGRKHIGILFPALIPVSYVEGMQEGDVLEFMKVDENVLFRLKLDQSSYRYRNHGKFHEVLARLINQAS